MTDPRMTLFEQTAAWWEKRKPRPDTSTIVTAHLADLKIWQNQRDRALANLQALLWPDTAPAEEDA